MVTLISESPLYIFSSKQLPKRRVTSVICHHGLLARIAASSSGPSRPHAVGPAPADIILSLTAPRCLAYSRR
jgi:hypothetical protein